ncbi:MAG: sulfatase [Gemmatimonadaceae bacterium]
MTGPTQAPTVITESRGLGRFGLPQTRARDVMLLALWCGAIAGLAEAGVSEVGARILHLPAGDLIPAEVFWIAPLAAAGCMLIVASLLLLIDRVVPAAGLKSLAFPIFVAMGVASFIGTLRQGVAGVAAAMLGIGVAIALVRVLARHPRFLSHTIPRTLAWMIGAMALYGAAIPVSRHLAERNAFAALPPASAGKPNVLIVVLDAVRQFDVSLYGYARSTTPNLTAFAKRGVVYDRAFATSPWSLPSHGSMLTGRYPNEMTAGHRQPLDGALPMLQGVLARHGYAAGGFVGNLSYLQPDFGIARDFTTYDSRAPISLSAILNTWWLGRTIFEDLRARRGIHQKLLRRNAEDVNQALLSWISRRGTRPFFAFINYFDAHEPYLPPAPFNRAFGSGGRYWHDELPRPYSPAELQQLRDAYDGSVQYMDAQLQRLLDALAARGELDKTIVIVTADHGEEFGEHDPSLVGHSLTLHTSSTLIPLILVYPPTVPAGMRRTEAVSLRDFPATVMELTGITADPPFPGVSLAAYARDSASRPPPTPRAMNVEKARKGALPSWSANDGNMFGVVDGQMHYFLDAQGQEHLYDLTSDIEERTNIAERPETAEVRTRSRFLLDSLMRGSNNKLRVRAPATSRGFGRGKNKGNK